jgi:glycosyltransferase involved in cell wall biosynthesis
MERLPQISIVTPSLNQGSFIAETIESVLAQDYQNFEHIIIDGGSTDGTLDTLQRYHHLKVISEPDRGQADAINKGFRFATGDIWAFLNSDDTLLPGALHRVAQEIDPQRGRHIVMGRCRFIDGHGHFLGVEHPSHFTSHRRVLEIWKGHMIPQPAVFWTPEVWHACGPMDESTFHLDYDLFCRFSRKYQFHCIDQVLATYRLHAESKTEQWTEADRLEDSIALSRRYWGSPCSLMYWQLTLSFAWYRFNRVGRARARLKQAQDAWRHGQVLQALPAALAGGFLAPEVVFYVGLYPYLRDRSRGLFRRMLDKCVSMSKVPPQTAVYLEKTEPWSDGWVGPRLTICHEAAGGEHALLVQGLAELRYVRRPLVLTAIVDGQPIDTYHIRQSGPFKWYALFPVPLLPGYHRVDIQANHWFVPHRFSRNGDYRPLAWQCESVNFTSAPI